MKHEIPAVLLFLGSMSLFSCTNNDIAPPPDRGITAEMAQTIALSRNAFLDASIEFDIAASAAQMDGFTGNKTLEGMETDSICGSITVAPVGNEYPKTITLDYGEQCIRHGDTLSGKIIFEISSPFIFTPGSSLSTTFEGFVKNGTSIEGSKTITINDKNEAGNYSATVQISNGKISNEEGFSTWESNGTLEWDNNDTYRLSDDKLKISGTANGSHDGVTFTSEISEPLIRQFSCRHISSGLLLIVSGESQASLDFGDGECDSKALFTYNGEETEITLGH